MSDDDVPNSAGPPGAGPMDAEGVLRAELAALRQQHRDLDDAIAALETGPRPDMLQVRRLKKRKLSLKDRMARVEDALTPDIIA